MFHLLLNLILGLKTLPQLKLHCVLNAIIECCLLKFIISIHIIKTTQLVTIFKSNKYIVSLTGNSLYKLCNMEDYLFIGIFATILLSIICSIKAFQSRKIPANFTETKHCIFLGIIATTIILLVLIPLEVSFRKVGQFFVQSCLIFCMDNTLLSITYGYKARIILSQKRKNTKEAFQKFTLKTIK